jgi:hypothetical protein
MIEENRPIGYKDGQYYFNYWIFNSETAYITIDSANKLTISGFNPTASRTDWAERKGTGSLDFMERSAKHRGVF